MAFHLFMFPGTHFVSYHVLLVACALGHFCFDELSTRLTMEPFAEKPIDNLASVSFSTELSQRRIEACLGVRHTIQFNSSPSRNCRNREGRETAEIVTVEKLQKSSRSRNCRNRHGRETAEIVCDALKCK